jgi:hypothetical protein
MSADVISFSFCQVSDLNLDSSAALELHLSPAQRKKRSEEALDALARAIKLASSNSVDAVLVPGNLFESEHITTYTLKRVQKIFALLGDIPVFIAPGANDPHFKDSPYDKPALLAHGLEPWSDNVFIFGCDKMQSFNLHGKGSVRINGIGISREGRKNTPAVPALDSQGKVAIDILLLPLGSNQSESSTVETIVQDALAGKGYSYTALSGLKNKNTFKSGNEIYAAAAGGFIGQTENDNGPRYAIFGNLDRRLSGELETSLQTKEFDLRRIHCVRVDLTPSNCGNAKDIVARALSKSTARAEDDIVILHLNGFYAAGSEFNYGREELNERYFHLRVYDNTRPDYLDTLSDRNLIESKFSSIIAEMKNKIVEAGTSDSRERLADLDDALYYGLEAIREGKVTIRNAD